MVKIKIEIEGEDITEIVDELIRVGLSVLKENRKELREVMKLVSDEAFEVLEDKRTLERGAELYRKLNQEINWTYKRDTKGP